MRSRKHDHIKKERDRQHKKILLITTILLLLTISVLGFLIVYNILYRDRVYKGVFLDDINIAYHTADEVKDIINQKYQLIENNSIHVRYNDEEYNLLDYTHNDTPITIRDLVHINTGEVISQALTTGRDKQLWRNIITQLHLYVTPKKIPIKITLNEALIHDILYDTYQEHTQEPTNAKFEFIDNSITVIPGEPGYTFDFLETINKINTTVARFSNQAITLELKKQVPPITKENSTRARSQAEILLEKTPIALHTINTTWELDRPELETWLELAYNKQLQTVDLELNHALMESYLTSKAIEIDILPLDAIFEMNNNRVTQFQREQEGQRLAIDQNIQRIKTSLLQDGITNIDLIVYIDQPKTKLANLTDLGLTDLLGTGISNFAGSPSNRRHNIQVGADSVNGTIVMPEDEFSLITVLGDIDAAAGYLPELVIKENRTIPEYGGGLCQIGTTTFRGALSAGLPITERRNHSYRVSYYEPAGTDATIYDPKPDFRFKNDTGNPVMITTHIDGDNLYFDFWGTSDGRIASRTDPVIYDITPPPPTKIIETLDLEPGVKRCTESAHNGAKAVFTYTVLYPDAEEPTEVEFFSHYRPWQEVCLLGVEELSSEKEENKDNNEKNDESTSQDDNNADTESVEQPPAPELATIEEEPSEE